ncbi:MAG: DUF3189 family protein [Eubacteriales bacterium]|nr:DUF3189 family protein [Bacillota bacterium]
MKVIYHCYGGTHSSVTAASIHLGFLPADRIPEKETFLRIPLYDRQEADEHGQMFFMGQDEFGNEVYIVARRNRPEVLENLMAGLAAMFDTPRDGYMLVNVMVRVNLTMMIGGFLSRRWGFIRMGRPIVTAGTQAAYFKVVKLVKDVRRELEVIHGKKSALFQRQQISPGSCGGGDSHRLFTGESGTGS